MSDWPYPAPVDRGGAAHLAAGLSLPDIALRATDGSDVNLSRLSGPTVVFVYPWTGRAGLDNPPDWDHIPGAHGSTPEAEGFRDLYERFQEIGVAVYGLSGQAPAHQSELASRLGLPFPLLSDLGLTFADALSLPRFMTGGESYLERLTLLVEDGRIARVFYPVHPPHTHARAVMDWLVAG